MSPSTPRLVVPACRIERRNLICSATVPDRPRTAYLITSYKLPDQVLRLASVLRRGSPDASIVVHHDDRGGGLDRRRTEELGVQLVEPPSAVTWGDFSQLAMVLRCLRWVIQRAEFDWLVLLSGQDYPIRSVAEIETLLLTSGVDGFIWTSGRCERPALRRAIDEFACRYYYRWQRVPAAVGSAVARAAATARPLLQSRVMPNGTWIGVPAVRSPFGHGLVCHYGFDWFTLSRKAIEAVDRFVRTRPDVLDFYRRTLIPTESFVHTALASDDSLRLSGDCRRYLVFDEEHVARPRILGLNDLDVVFASGADFARKFDETLDRAVLDEIDRRVHGGAIRSI